MLRVRTGKPAVEIESAAPKAGGGGRDSPRKAAIDFIRALSILWIVGIWHVLDYFPELAGFRNDVTHRVTVTLLALFVLVSGYLMGLKDVRLTPAMLKEFYFNRFARIYPPFLVACLLFAGLKLASLTSLIKGALLVAMLWGPPPPTLWFIAMITLFYLITPVLLALRGSGWRYLAVVALLTAALAVAQGLGGAVSPRLAMYLPAYCFGLWLALGKALWNRVAISGCLAAVLAGAISTFADTSLIENSVWSMPWAFATSATFFGAAMAFDRHLSRWSWAVVVAEASYFLYLLHRPVYAVGLKIFRPDDWGSRAAFIVLILLPLAVALAWAGQRFYDAAWRRVREKAGG